MSISLNKKIENVQLEASRIVTGGTRLYSLRDRPFNLKGGEGGGYGFLFRSEFFFRTTQELEYLFFLSR